MHPCCPPVGEWPSADRVVDGLSSLSLAAPTDLKGTRRDDVLVLEDWLSNVMSKVVAEAQQDEGQACPATGGSSHWSIRKQRVIKGASMALHVYQATFDRLTQQVRHGCRERGELLENLWKHFFTLVSFCQSLAYERALEQAQEHRNDLERNIKERSDRLHALQTHVENLRSEHTNNVGKLDQERRNVVHQLAKAQISLKEKCLEAERLSEKISVETAERLRAEDACRMMADNLAQERTATEKTEAALGAATKRVRAMQCAVDQAQAGLLKKTTELEEVKGHLETTRRTIAQEERELNVLRNELAASRDAVDKLTGQVADKDRALEISRCRCCSLEDEVTQLRNESQEFQERLATVEGTLQVKIKTKQQSDMLYTSLKRKHEDAKQTVEALERNVQQEKEAHRLMRAHAQHTESELRGRVRQLQKKLEDSAQSHKVDLAEWQLDRDDLDIQKGHLMRLSEVLDEVTTHNVATSNYRLRDGSRRRHASSRNAGRGVPDLCGGRGTG
eukprot:scaffold266_cov391-Prasinococcus_capsulatus_cf.AAC.7